MQICVWSVQENALLTDLVLFFVLLCLFFKNYIVQKHIFD